MDINDFKAKYPDLYKTIFDEGRLAGSAGGFAKGEETGLKKGKSEGRKEGLADGAQAERERIQSVEAQLIPGHEKLIQALKFDGETTGEQAAVQILQAEKALRLNIKEQLEADSVDAVSHIAVQGAGDDVSSLPEGFDKWKAQYERSAELQKEYKSCEIYTAFKQGVADGRVMILGKEVK